MRKLEWLETWNALVDLRLEIHDTVSFNPGVTFVTPNWLDAHVWLADGTRRTFPQSYNFGVGGGVSYSPSREDLVQFAYPFDMFLNERREIVETPSDKPCYSIGGITIQGDLKLSDWLDDVLEPVKKCAFLGTPVDAQQNSLLSTFSGPEEQSERCRRTDFRQVLLGNPISTITHQVQFTITFDANATPAWSLVRVAASRSPEAASLFDVARTDTSQLLMTIGPPSEGKGHVTKVTWPKGSNAGNKLSPVSTTTFPSLSAQMILTHQALEIRAFGGTAP